jgi:tetratricopeptide (TPR) repeat protein
MLQINPFNLAQRGVEALKAGKLGPAVTLLRAASEAFPENVEIRLQLAAAISYTGAHGEALVHYREALRLQPQNPDVHYNLGTTLWILGRNQEALVHLRRAVELHPEYAEARFNLAQTLRRLGRDAEALKELDEVLRLAPRDIRALLARPRVLARLGRCEEAVASARSGLEGDPGNVPLTDVLARALAACPEGQGRDPRSALRLAREVFAAQPTADHAATVALAEGAGGGWARAAAWQRRALDLLPAATAPEARQALVEQLGSYEQRILPGDW